MYAQVYPTDFGWGRVHPMKCRNEAHETLSLLLTWDNAKEMIHGKFYQKCKDSLCWLKQLESYTLCSNAEEWEITDLKKGTSHKLLWSRALKCFWNDCLELETFTSNTFHNIHKLDTRRNIRYQTLLQNRLIWEGYVLRWEGPIPRRCT